MNKGPVLVAIDSGGTRTNVEVEVDGETQRKHSYESSHTLSGSLSPSRYADTLRKLLAPLEAYWHDESLDGRETYVFISAAGYAQPTREDFMEAMTGVFPDVLDGSVRAAGAANDATTLLFGHEADVAVIAGTGSNVIVRSKDGAIYQSGGHGWVACDYGSGFWIGLRAIRQAARDFEAGEDSVILQRFKQLYSIRSDDDRRMIAKLRDLSIADEAMKGEVARFAASVCDAAERGDLAAQNITKLEAEDLADSTASALRRRLDRSDLDNGVTVVQCGGLLSNRFYRAAFEAQVEMRLLSGDGEPANLTWVRVPIGTPAALNLARGLSGDTEQLLQIDLAFRPVVVRF